MDLRLHTRDRHSGEETGTLVLHGTRQELGSAKVVGFHVEGLKMTQTQINRPLKLNLAVCKAILH